MKRCGMLAISVFLLSLFVLPSPLTASVQVLPAYYSGTRTTDAGDTMIIDNSWDPAYGLRVDYVISGNALSGWHYQYTITLDPANANRVSHWILQLSDFVNDTNLDQYVKNPSGFTLDTQVANLDWTSAQGNPNLPGTLHGIKITPIDPDGSGPLPKVSVYSFDSPSRPVWGDFYVKDGGKGQVQYSAWNTGIGDSENATSPYSAWLPTPDTTGGDVPEPLSLAIWSLLGSLGLSFGWRRHRKAA